VGHRPPPQPQPPPQPITTTSSSVPRIPRRPAVGRAAVARLECAVRLAERPALRSAAVQHVAQRSSVQRVARGASLGLACRVAGKQQQRHPSFIHFSFHIDQDSRLQRTSSR